MHGVEVGRMVLLKLPWNCSGLLLPSIPAPTPRFSLPKSNGLMAPSTKLHKQSSKKDCIPVYIRLLLAQTWS